MIASLALALLAALPVGEARYRLELAGLHVGAATLSVRCGGDVCTAAWTTRTRLPDETGGELAEARVTLELGRDGRSLGAAARVERDGRTREVPGVAGAVPALVAALVLEARLGGGCVPAYDEETGVRGEACGRRTGERVEATVMGERWRVRAGGDGFPGRVEVPGQRAVWVRDAAAAPPAAPPRLFRTRVGGPARARSFCGRAPDPAPPAPNAPLPAAAGDGRSCREVTLDYLALAAERGHEGRVAVGLAWDGEALAWHAWAELREGEAWVPVDPTFRQLPARGPRFTVARYAPDDPAARLAAGRAVLACWGEAAR